MSARLLATDSSQQELLVADLETALGTLSHARLRTSDIVAVRVPLEQRAQEGRVAPTTLTAMVPISTQDQTGDGVGDTTAYTG